jgi:hypothetical protein
MYAGSSFLKAIKLRLRMNGAMLPSPLFSRHGVSFSRGTTLQYSIICLRINCHYGTVKEGRVIYVMGRL